MCVAPKGIGYQGFTLRNARLDIALRPGGYLVPKIQTPDSKMSRNGLGHIPFESKEIKITFHLISFVRKERDYSYIYNF